MRDKSGPAHVLVAEDDTSLHPVCRAMLQHVFGAVRVDAVSTTEEALALLARQRYDLVLADYYLASTGTGLDLLEETARTSPDTVRVLMTGRPDAEMARAALDRVRVHGFIHKNGNAGALADRLTAVLAKF